MRGPVEGTFIAVLDRILAKVASVIGVGGDMLAW
jgi:hypothetical protein